jgi:hypothetical protein
MLSSTLKLTFVIFERACVPRETVYLVNINQTWVARGTVYLVNIGMATYEFNLGYLIGLTVAEGSFTADRQQPSFQFRLHEDNPEPIQRLIGVVGGVIYGPYNHNDRKYYVLMLRGPALWKAVEIFYQHLPYCKKRQQFIDWWKKHQTKLPPLPPELEEQTP